ncbi:response regulator [Candidatus Thalassolituus haligoni]|uniref:response regulator n=1 Tax=Candidatus Thalassolituus haligoni TaxID=3100113 RepID=UPI0035150E45
MTTSNKYPILQVDDHTIFRSGLSKLLAESECFMIQAEAATIEQACACLQQQPELALMILDINLAGQNSLDQIPLLRQFHADIPILIMSMYPPDQFAAAAYRAGANAYLSKDACHEELQLALSSIVTGGIWLNPSARLATDDTPNQGYPHERLSERELDILKSLANGESLTDIGSRMFLSVKTVSTYRTRILEKLNLTNNAELIKYALTHGLSV